MSITPHLFDPNSVTATVQAFIDPLEGFSQTAYWDTAKTPQPTIGYGINLTNTQQYDNLQLVLQEIYGTAVNVSGFVSAFANQSVTPTQVQLTKNRSLYNGQLQSLLNGLSEETVSGTVC